YSVPLPPAELGKRLSGPQWDDLLSYMPMTLHQAVERNFESEYVRMFFNCILHAIAIENVPGVGAFFPRLLSRLTKLGLPVGGAGSVALALERLLVDNGATLIRNGHVSAITSDSKGVTGVRLQNGDTYSARFVASAIDAPQTIGLAGEQNFPAKVVEGIKGFKWCSHSLVTLHLALNEAPRYEKAEAWDPDVARAWNMIFGADTTDQIDRIFDDIHEQKLPTYFAGNGTCSSKFDPSIGLPASTLRSGGRGHRTISMAIRRTGTSVRTKSPIDCCRNGASLRPTSPRRTWSPRQCSRRSTSNGIASTWSGAATTSAPTCRRSSAATGRRRTSAATPRR
ncbi:MAG: hypothetical protein WB764_02535, partial [Xanthobacteraceae bacterium]